MVRRIAASFIALFASVVIVAPAAQADETPAPRDTHSIVKPAPEPSYSRARWIDWD